MCLLLVGFLLAGCQANAARSGLHARDQAARLRPGETLWVGACEQGGARWTFEPQLSTGVVDFAAAALPRQGLIQDADGVVGPGWCEIPFFLPGPIDDTKEGGARLTLCATGEVQLAVNDAFGNWLPMPLAAMGRDETMVLASALAGRHTFSIRLTIGAQARVSRFRLEAVLQPLDDLAPVLEEGINIRQLQSKDRYGLPTVPWDLPVDFRRAATVPLAERVTIREGGVQPLDETRMQIAPRGRDAVEATVAWEAPDGASFAWFTIQSVVRTATQTGAEGTVTMAWRREGGAYEMIAELACTTNGAGRQTYAGRVLLDRSQRRIFVRVTSPFPIEDLQGSGQLDRPAMLPVRPVILHRWMEQGVPHQFQAPLSCDQYYFRCGPQPTGQTVEWSVPSRMIPIVNAGMPSL